MILDNENHKDKLIDYFKFISGAHLAVIGVVITFNDRFLSGVESELVFYILIFVLVFSLALVMYGYVCLIDSYFKQARHHQKIIEYAKSCGYILIPAVVVFLIQTVTIWS